MNPFKPAPALALDHEVDVCVVGGGIAGLCAALSAARSGVKALLMQDRPVLGGNASSEIRMWLCGADPRYYREAGIVEELLLENYYRNQSLSYSVWDSVLYGAAQAQPGLTTLLNCSCVDASAEGGAITAVTGWQATTETVHTVSAKYFIDCSGDAWLAALSGAEFMMGREARDAYGESLAPDERDGHTMGQSCLLQFREYATPQTFVPPSWAYTYPTDESLPSPRHHIIDTWQNFWWLELGGDADILHDTEKNRDELLKIAFGICDHIKNHGDHGADNWNLDWVGFLPGKRESRRCTGDYILRQEDVVSGTRFDDEVAYGGWPMDDHPPAGFYHDGDPCVQIKVGPYGIPLRCLHSKNISNLLFAGRNISATHVAFSSTRVMSTCGALGQAAGTAAAQAVVSGKDLRDLDIRALQQSLLRADCYLPGVPREQPELTRRAAADAEALRSGIDRETPDGTKNLYTGPLGKGVGYRFEQPVHIREIRLVFDSCLPRAYKNMPSNFFLQEPWFNVPETLVKGYKLVARTEAGEVTLYETDCNYQRLRLHEVDVVAEAVTLIPLSTWGAEEARVFAMDAR